MKIYQISGSGNTMTSNVDVFFAEVLYNKSRYNCIFYSYEEKSTTKNEMTGEEITVLTAEKEFKILIKINILIQKIGIPLQILWKKWLSYTIFTLSNESR